MNERKCHSVDGNLIGDSCATCAGLTAGAGKRNMQRKCVWHDPAAGIHCFADAKPEAKREKWRKVAEKRRVRPDLLIQPVDAKADHIKAEQAPSNVKRQALPKWKDLKPGINPIGADYSAQVTAAGPESVMEIDIVPYDHALLKLVCQVGETNIHADKYKNIRTLYFQTWATAYWSKSKDEAEVYLEFVNRMKWMLSKGHGISCDFMMKWLQAARAVLSYQDICQIARSRALCNMNSSTRWWT